MPITPVKDDEYEAWKECFAGFIAHMNATLPESQYQNTWSRIRKLDPEQDNTATSDRSKGDIGCLVARNEDGRIVGLTHWFDLGRSWKMNKEVYLEDLWVFPSARGHGYGKQLILASADVATKEGSDAMHWTTGLENVWAGRLYDRIAHMNHRWYSMDLPYTPKTIVEETK